MSHHTWRRLVVAMSAATALCLTVAGGPAAASVPGGDARPAEQAARPLPVPPPGNDGVGQAALQVTEDCAPASAQVRATVKSAATECITVTEEPVPDRTRVTTTEVQTTALADGTAAAEDPGTYDPGVWDPDPAEPPVAASCAINQEESSYVWTRTGGLCGKIQVTYTLYDTNGRPVGTGLIDVSTHLRTAWDSTKLGEEIQATVTDMSGQVTALNIRFRTDCTSSCLPTLTAPWYGNTALAKGQSKSGEVTYSVNIPTGATRSEFRTGYTMYVTTAGATPLDASATWSSPEDVPIRCDSEMPTTSGCVIPEPDDTDAPILEYSLSSANHGQASATYELGLRMRGSSLFHGENKSNADANRTNTCGSAKFTNLFPGATGADSCDEFPFAGTQEGGTDGLLCAEITPTLVNGHWTTPATDPNKPVTNQPCIQSHMPLYNNKSAGGVYGNFKKFNRIIQGDAFWMAIVP
ncbi:hypothetical protein ACFXAZ_26165 [Streptomyces sp. NPDC059477]|uniref:NucA/NucB deoxyribonuclease domain-containing protein n=1 Tax=Streptomyces sp. NPDC059477 TaxID=3346847 RepID=UPI00369EF4D7